jgi:hypothetical protein
MDQLGLIGIDEVVHAKRRGHKAAGDAAAKAERVVDPEWGNRALDALRKFVTGAPGLFTMEMARGVLELQGAVPEPPDKRAWGSVTRIAAQQGIIERTKTYHPSASSNGSEKPCYRRGPKV